MYMFVSLHFYTVMHALIAYYLRVVKALHKTASFLRGLIVVTTSHQIATTFSGSTLYFDFLRHHFKIRRGKAP